jgi:hypothetical protein
MPGTPAPADYRRHWYDDLVPCARCVVAVAMITCRTCCAAAVHGAKVLASWLGSFVAVNTADCHSGTLEEVEAMVRVAQEQQLIIITMKSSKVSLDWPRACVRGFTSPLSHLALVCSDFAAASGLLGTASLVQVHKYCMSTGQWAALLLAPKTLFRVDWKASLKAHFGLQLTDEVVFAYCKGCTMRQVSLYPHPLFTTPCHPTAPFECCPLVCRCAPCCIVVDATFPPPPHPHAQAEPVGTVAPPVRLKQVGQALGIEEARVNQAPLLVPHAHFFLAAL